MEVNDETAEVRDDPGLVAFFQLPVFNDMFGWYTSNAPSTQQVTFNLTKVIPSTLTLITEIYQN